MSLLDHLPLHTARLTLRAATEADLDAMAVMLADPEVMRYFPRPMMRPEAEAFIRRNLDRYRGSGTGLFAVCHEGVWVGDCGLIVRQIDGRPQLELGYHFRREVWGRGYAAEAAQACLGLAWRAREASSVVALIRPENVRSRRVAQRVGMRPEGAAWHAGYAHEMWFARRPLPASG